MNDFVALWPILAVAVLFWLLIIRPASRQRRQTAQMQSDLAVGDRVMLTSGFFGELRSIDDDRVDLELTPGTVVTVARAAIARVVPLAGPADVEPTHGTQHEPTSPDLTKHDSAQRLDAATEQTTDERSRATSRDAEGD